METFDTKIASLLYLTNPLYQGILKQKNQTKTEISKTDIKFYRKRISALTKDMLKGDIPKNTYIKTLYETYVNGLVKYFKMIDTNDIIQQQYNTAIDAESHTTINEDTASDILDLPDSKDINLENMNDVLIRKHASINTLDNFVIKTTNTENDIRIIPVILDVDLTNPTLKTKGVKDKSIKGNKGNKGKNTEVIDPPEDIILVKKNI